MEKITVDAHIKAPVEKVWELYTNPSAIVQWNAASEDWHCPHAENDLQEGGKFLSHMEAKDGSEGFDFTGTYTEVVEHAKIGYIMDDGREVAVSFMPEGEMTHMTVSFDPESLNSEDLQRSGWQAILDNFKQYVEIH